MLKMKFECDMRWEDLDGESDIRRHCGVCEKEVFNITAMTRDMAQRLLSGTEKPCVRYVSRNGRVVHNGDPAEQLRRQNVGAGKLLAGALLIHAAFIAVVDSPGDFAFDPLSLVGKSTAERIQQDVETKFEAQQQVVTGVVF